MNNPITERRKQRAQGGIGGVGPGPVLTEMGDPQFSPSQGSQAQVPAAAAQARIFQNQKRAQNAIRQGMQMGYDVFDDDWSQVHAQAEDGFVKEQKGFIGSLVGWVAGPFYASNLLIQQLAGVDPGEGYRNVNFGDYLDLFFGGGPGMEEFEAETGFYLGGATDILAEMGWEEEEELGGRILRGVADFATQILIDPLSYLTFGLSGLGRKVALSTAQAFTKNNTRRVLQHLQGGQKMGGHALSPYERYLAANYDDIVQKFQNRLVEKAGKVGGELPPEMQSSLSNYLGRSDNIWENIGEVALAERQWLDVTKPLISRDFRNINKLALEELPLWASGGARISVPLTKGTLTHGVAIPGTQGLGRTLVGDPLRHLSEGLKKFGPYHKLTDAIKKGTSKMDQMAPLLRALKAGDIEGWQFHIASTALDNMTNNVARHTISTELNSQWNLINDLAKKHGVDVDAIGADMLYRLEGNNMDDVILKQMGAQPLDDVGWRLAHPELARSTDALLTYMQEVMGSYHEALSVLDPTFKAKFIDGYVPHSVNKEARDIITALSGTGHAPAATGDTVADMVAQFLNAAGKGGVAEPNMGVPRHVDRTVGRVSSVQLTDDGVVMLDRAHLAELAENAVDLIDPASGAVSANAVKTQYMPVPQLNEMLAPHIRKLAIEHDIPVPKNWDGKIFNENPITTMIDYVENMTDAINAWQTVDSLRASGLAFKHMTNLDTQQVIQNMMTNVVNNSTVLRTTKHAKPTPGAVEEAPVEWLERIVDVKDYQNAFDDLAGVARRHPIPEPEGALGGMAPPKSKPKDYTGMVDDVAKQGVHTPVRVAVWEDGSVQILDGHHRIAAAKEAGQDTVPVQVVRETDMDILPKNGVNVREHMQPGWWQGGDNGSKIVREIESNPDQFAFRSGKAENLESTRKGGTTAGGIYAERGPAEEFVRHSGEAPGSRIIYVYRRDELAPSIRQPLDRAGEIGDIRGAPPARAIGYYDPQEGLGSFRFMDEAKEGFDVSTGHNMDEAFNTLPWNPQVIEEHNLLYGAEKQSGLAGVSKSVKLQVDDSGVMNWNSLDDVASSRRLANRVRSSQPEEWSTGAPVPDPSVQIPETKATKPWKWETTTDADGTQRATFGLDPDVKVPKGSPRPYHAPEDPVVRATVRGGANPKLHLELAPDLDLLGRNNARRAATNYLDKQFRPGGKLAGKFNDEGIQELIDAGMDEFTASVLHEYTGLKINSMGRDAVEFISKEPAEIFQTRALFDSWARGINDFIRQHAAVRTPDGKLIADPNQLSVVGTKQVRDQLAELKRSALMLGERGYDNAVRVMSDVEAYTGVQSIKDYINPQHFNLAGPAVSDLTMQKDIAEWMSLVARNMGTIYTPEGVAAAKMAANETLKWWRAMATLPRPGFHIRNLIGASWMNMNFGVTSSSMQSAAAHGMAFRRALSQATGPEGIEQAFARLPEKMRPAWREAWEHNVLAGFATTEFTDAITPAAKRKRWDWANAFDTDNFALTRAGGKVMESVEDFVRMSLFLEYYDAAVPGSARMAADMVNAVHFDYSNLTPTETRLKSVIPFFVWTRRNIPLQLQLMVENPRYLERYRAMMSSMNDNLGGRDPNNLEEADFFSAYAAGTSYKVNPNSPFWGRVMIDPDLPLSDLLDLPNPDPADLMRWSVDILGPHMSILTDLNAQREFGDVNAPAPLSVVLQGLAAVGLYDRTTDGDVRVPYYMRTLLETGAPMIREVMDPMTGGPTDPNRRARYGITEDDGYIEASLKSMGHQILGGFGAKLTTPADARSAAFRSDSELTDVINSLRLRGKAPPAGS